MVDIVEIADITTFDGHEIEVVVHRAGVEPSSPSLVVLTHGIFTDRDEGDRFVRLASRLCEAGFDVARFDFRGHGSSPFSSERFTVSGAMTDYLAVIRWAGQGWTNIAVIGSSFGGSIVLLERLLPLKADLFGVVLLNPVVDYRGTFLQPEFEWAKGLFSEKNQKRILKRGCAEIQSGFKACQALLVELATMEPWRGAGAIDASAVVYHGDADNKVPLGLTLARLAAMRDISMEVIEEGDHAFTDPEKEQLVHGRAVEWLRCRSREIRP